MGGLGTAEAGERTWLPKHERAFPSSTAPTTHRKEEGPCLAKSNLLKTNEADDVESATQYVHGNKAIVLQNPEKQRHSAASRPV
jgi:hypothetical protein